MRQYDALIAVFKYFEPKVSRIPFWQGIDKCKDGALRYQNENIHKPERKRKLRFFEELFIVLIVLLRLKTGLFLLNLNETFDVSVSLFQKLLLHG